MFSTYLIYFIVLFLSTVSLYFADQANTRLKKAIFVTLSFMIVFVISSIRYNVGSDYPNYAEIFYSIQDGGSKDIEVGFRYINLLFSSLGFGFQSFVFFISFITYFIFYRSYPKEKSYIYHFVFLCTLYLYTLSNLRSSIVYGLSFIAILKYMDDNKILNFCLLIFFSMLFHKSSVVYLIIPIIFSKPVKDFVKNKYIPEVILFLLIAMMFNSSWLRSIIFYNPISEVLGFSSYANHEKWGGGE
ncbi:EpsG family protein [Vibrio aestuarianus]|uniref:EpsG family protein n=1 Tax=Vibrio aestuarianus TaxID=28171 RepID=UPI00237C5412|nr:EpsG family protein [Vibrio aestuarianus]MDE1239238.1 EpsG family protein [Vibrio aestuarianus]